MFSYLYSLFLQYGWTIDYNLVIITFLESLAVYFTLKLANVRSIEGANIAFPSHRGQRDKRELHRAGSIVVLVSLQHGAP